MRQKHIYKGLKKDDLITALLNLSRRIEYISLLISNCDYNKKKLPKDYSHYDFIAGVGAIDLLVANKNSFNKLQRFHSKKKDWLFGSLSYDLKNENEKLLSKNTDNFNAPNLSFFVPEYVILFRENIVEIQTYHCRITTDKFVNSFDFSELPVYQNEISLIRREDKKSYLNKIERIKKHIQQGDIYEINYCQEFYAFAAKFLSESVFFELNKRMQTPFSAFIKLNEKYILSSSPERFLKKQSNYILSQPIKGTRKRGENKLEDIKLKNELKNSEKEIAENIMITDLVRNDLSITAKIKSVTVQELCKVYTFNRVNQMITSVVSEIDEKVNFVDVLKSTFPMGSMTGAPKLRAMELIEEFEDFKRGFFSGAVGYITPQADFDFNVVIRTILYNLENNYLSIAVGGAITIKSDSIEEYNECLIKSKPLFDVLNFKLDD